MMKTASPPRGQPVKRVTAKGTRLSLTQYLAIAGALILLWEVWTLLAWLTDSPHQVTEFRDPYSANWYAARVFEVVFLVGGLITCYFVVRGCIRARTITFDAMFCLVGLTLFWADNGVNFFQPAFLYSSNWLNLNNPVGHMPFVVNPDAGRVPDPLLFTVMMESFMWLVGCKIALIIDRKVRVRWPGISTLKRLLLLGGIGINMQLLFEIPIVSLGLWTYTMPRRLSIPLFGYRLPYVELLAGGSFFACGAALYVLRDGQGRRFVERGLSHVRPQARKPVTLLALYFVMQFIIWIPTPIPIMVLAPYQTQWPEWPAWLVNKVCDAPGIEGTRYGNCPGSPGYEMPGRHSRPGKSP